MLPAPDATAGEHLHTDVVATAAPSAAVNLRLIVALLASAHRALPSSAHEAGQYIVRASLLLAQPAEMPARDTAAPLTPRQLDCIDRWIEAHVDDAIQVEQLAALVCLSRSHFSRAFHRTTGKTPLAYVHRRRIERAQQLMLTTRRSLAQIALDCGLSDQCHLTRVFRRVTGTTPANWRRIHAR